MAFHFWCRIWFLLILFFSFLPPLLCRRVMRAVVMAGKDRRALVVKPRRHQSGDEDLWVRLRPPSLFFSFSLTLFII